MSPTLVIAIDQGEELFLAEAQGEAQPFLALLRDLVVADAPAVIASSRSASWSLSAERDFAWRRTPIPYINCSSMGECDR
jgi:hypothetical protein